MRLVIEQKDGPKPGWLATKGFTYQINDGPVRGAAKSSVLGQVVRLLVRLCTSDDSIIESWGGQVWHPK